MGCCMSTNTPEKSSALGPQKLQHSLVGTQGPRSDDAHDSRAPPPVDEETVKEVLSETPRPKPTPSSPPQPPLMPFTEPQEHEPVDQDQEKRAQEPVVEKKIKQEDPEKIEEKIPIYNNNGEISEVSETCSLSESMSTTTIIRDDDEEVHQRVNRSPMRLSKNRDPLGQRREQVVCKSPARRTESSPGRRHGPNGNNGAGSVRLFKSREPGPGQQPLSRRGSRAESNRRDPGESSGRRSRSPATRVTDVGRSPSARRSGRYSRRTSVGPVESSSSTRRYAEEPMMEEGRWPANESIDNPLVSLECFIFL